MSKYCLFLIVIYYLTGGNNSMSRFCKFGKLHVTKGNVDKLYIYIRVPPVNQNILLDFFCNHGAVRNMLS